MLTALGLAAVVALIIANGYFVAAEFAFVAARRTRLEDLADSGDRRARHATSVLGQLSFMLSGAQLGITVTSLVVGFIAEDTIGAALQPLVEAAGVPDVAARGLSLSLGFVLATGAQMVFGELAPKNLAIARPEPVALWLASSIRLFLRISGPVIRLFDNSANGLLRRLGIEPVEELGQGVSAEELAHIIDESERQGDLSNRQATLLARVLHFRALRAGAVMVPRTGMTTIGADATCDELRRLAISTGLSRFPVVAEGSDDVIGVVQAKSVIGVPTTERATLTVGALMREPLAVPESALLGPLLSDLRARHTHLAIVIDEHGSTAGLVSLEDLLEELVGEIHDEHDRPEPAVLGLTDGSFRVPGSWRLDETRRDTGVELPRGDFDTISGLVMAELDRLPEVGDVVELSHAILEVERLAGHAVGSVRLIPTPDPGDDAPLTPDPAGEAQDAANLRAHDPHVDEVDEVDEPRMTDPRADDPRGTRPDAADRPASRPDDDPGRR